TSTPGGSTVMHVAAMLTTDVNGNPQTAFTVGNPIYYRVEIVDQNNNPVSGATVNTSIIRPDGSTWTTKNATTGSNGWALNTQNSVKNNPTGTYTINVTGVTLSGATYNASANVVSSTTFTLS
ncbi:MAG TPA: hypothetical protein VKQ72_19030, partial [Aggregatilineales bacterium]|nr:hypothetical protein [Aggregatilineales bacterium]